MPKAEKTKINRVDGGTAPGRRDLRRPTKVNNYYTQKKITYDHALFSENCTCNKCRPEDYANEHDRHEDPALPDAFWRTKNKASMLQDPRKPPYEPLRLVDSSINAFANEEQHTEVVKDSLAQWVYLQFCGLFESDVDGKSGDISPSITRLRLLFSIFDGVFCAGSLQHVNLTYDSDLKSDYGVRCVGLTSGIKDRSLDWLCQITIDPECAWTGLNGKHKCAKRFQSVAGVLLHEMWHAFLNCYSCRGWNIGLDWTDCDKNSKTVVDSDPMEIDTVPAVFKEEPPPCINYQKDNRGRALHGRAWHLAGTVENSARKLMVLELKLFNWADVELEFNSKLSKGENDSDRWIPSRCDIARIWRGHMHKDYVEDRVKKIRTELRDLGLISDMSD